MNKNAQHNLMALMLLGLFLSFQVCITAFTHVHILNGVHIVHSHPSKDAQHEHNAEQLVTIGLLSTFHAEEATFTSYIGLGLPLIQKLDTTLYHNEIRDGQSRLTSLRAPPCC